MAYQLCIGKPIVKPLTWSIIGKIGENSLYLCDSIIDNSCFGETNDYMLSEVRKRCLSFYESLTDEERACLVNHPEIGDPVFLLSVEEYKEHKEYITPTREPWHLRSQDDESRYRTLHVGYSGRVWQGLVWQGLVYEEPIGIRPAILVKE